MAKTRRRKKRTHVEEGQDPNKKPDPRTFVFRRGKHGALLADLEQDLRRMMLPNTAMNLRESQRNTMKDFVAVAGPLGVTHFLMLSATEQASYLKVAKTPRGPTLTLRVHGYSLMRDVVSAQSRPRLPPAAFKAAPLLVLNQFQGAPHIKLAGTLLQGMFPALHVSSMKVASCKRVVCLSYDPATDRVSLRHYTISLAPTGVKKSVRALLARQLPKDLGSMQDASELLTKGGYGSESEGEDAEASRVTLPAVPVKPSSRGGGSAAAAASSTAAAAAAACRSRVRLHEVGPRLELEVVKVEEGLADGRVLYHAHVSKTEEEAGAQEAALAAARRLKAQRRKQQEENVARKAAEKRRREVLEEEAGGKETKRAKAARQKQQQQWTGRQEEGEVEDDDDEEYFRQEVGEEPDEEDKMGFHRRGGAGGGRHHHRGGRGGRGGACGGRGRGHSRHAGGGSGRGRGGSGRGRGGSGSSQRSRGGRG